MHLWDISKVDSVVKLCQDPSSSEPFLLRSSIFVRIIIDMLKNILFVPSGDFTLFAFFFRWRGEFGIQDPRRLIVPHNTIYHLRFILTSSWNCPGDSLRHFVRAKRLRKAIGL